MNVTKRLNKLAMEYSHKRCKIPNDHRGKVFMSCLIIDKNIQCLLWPWDKFL